MIEAFEGTLPDGWQGGEPITRHWRGAFTHLYRVTRPCVSCTATISLDVTKKALQGFSKNAGLLLRNCPTCREARKNAGPGSRGGKSRPRAEAVDIAPIAGNELETLRMANNVMKDELAGLYARDKDLFAENQVLKARLAKFELQGAMSGVATKVNGWDTTTKFEPPDYDASNARHAVPALTFPWDAP